MDTETLPDPPNGGGKREAAAAILAAWSRVSVRGYPGYWSVAGIDPRGKPWAGHTAHQQDVDDPCDVALRLLALSDEHWASVDAQQKPAALNVGGYEAPWMKSADSDSGVDYAQRVMDAESEVPASISAQDEPLHVDASTLSPALTDGEKPDAATEAAQTNEADDEPGNDATSDDRGEETGAESGDGIGGAETIADDILWPESDVSGLDDADSMELPEPDDAGAFGVADGEGGALEGVASREGVAFAQDELSAQRTALINEIDRVAEALIFGVTPDEAKEASRLAYLRNGLILGALNDDERAEATRLEAHVGWRASVHAHATELKLEIASAPLEYLEIFDAEDGWPPPPE